MTEETIVLDVSDAETLPDGSEGSEENQPETGMIPDNPIARREAKLKDLHEKRVEEREGDRRTAALINNPDMTGEEYDAQNVPPSGNEANAPAGEGDQQIQAGPGDNSQPNAGEEPGPGEPSPAALNGWHENESGQTVRSLSVNGRMVEVTQEQYERFAQKDMAGDEKLNRAAAVEKVLTQREKTISERERVFEANSQPPAGAGDESLDSMIDEFQEAITEGDLDVARDKMRDLIKSGRQEPTLDMETVVAQATTRMERNAEQKVAADDVTDGYEEFQRQYSDVFDDDDALAFADIQMKNLKRDKPEMPFSERALEAGRITRDRLGLQGGGNNLPTGDADQLRTERQARKATLTPIPGTGKAHKVAEKPKRDLSPSANIARMRAGRAR